MNLLQALIEDKQDFYREHMENIRRNTSSHFDQLEKILDVYIEHIVLNAAMHRIIQQQVFHGKNQTLRDAMFKKIKKNFSNIKLIIQSGIDAGEFRPVDVPIFVMSLLGTIFQFIRSEELTLILLQEAQATSHKKKQLTAYQHRLSAFLHDYIRNYLQP